MLPNHCINNWSSRAKQQPDFQILRICPNGRCCASLRITGRVAVHYSSSPSSSAKGWIREAKVEIGHCCWIWLASTHPQEFGVHRQCLCACSSHLPSASFHRVSSTMRSRRVQVLQSTCGRLGPETQPLKDLFDFSLQHLKVSTVSWCEIALAHVQDRPKLHAHAWSHYASDMQAIHLGPASLEVLWQHGENFLTTTTGLRCVDCEACHNPCPKSKKHNGKPHKLKHPLLKYNLFEMLLENVNRCKCKCN